MKTDTARTAQWAPEGPMSGVPSVVMRLLATADGKTFGYGYGPGWSVVFGSEQGGVAVLPGQWVTCYPDGRIEVTDEPPKVSTTPVKPEACCDLHCSVCGAPRPSGLDCHLLGVPHDEPTEISTTPASTPEEGTHV